MSTLKSPHVAKISQKYYTWKTTKRCNAHVNDFNKLKNGWNTSFTWNFNIQTSIPSYQFVAFCFLSLYGEEAHFIFIAFKLHWILNIIGNIFDFLGKLLMSQIDRFCTSKTVQIFVNAYNREFLVVVIFHCALLLTTN